MSGVLGTANGCVCFQVPAVTIEYGITIVVSPLLALMRDQVSGLQEKGIAAYQLSEKTDPNQVREVSDIGITLRQDQEAAAPGSPEHEAALCYARDAF